jgi:hypothetical protein
VSRAPRPKNDSHRFAKKISNAGISIPPCDVITTDTRRAVLPSAVLLNVVDLCRWYGIKISDYNKQPPKK